MDYYSVNGNYEQSYYTETNENKGQLLLNTDKKYKSTVSQVTAKNKKGDLFKAHSV